MKNKRKVKFDTNNNENTTAQERTLEAIQADIDKVEARIEKRNRTVQIKEKLLLGTAIIGVAGIVSGFLTLIGSAGAHSYYETETNENVKIITLFDEYQEIYNNETDKLLEDLKQGNLTTQQFEQKLKYLKSTEYIKSIAPEFCTEKLINELDENIKNQEKSENIILGSFIGMGASAILSYSAYGADLITDKLAKKADSTDTNKCKKLYDEYKAKERKEENENCN